MANGDVQFLTTARDKNGKRIVQTIKAKEAKKLRKEYKQLLKD
jgi:hypothetical protein